MRDPAGDSGSASTEPAPAPSDTPVLQTRLLSDHLSCSNKGREQVQEAEEVEIDLEMNVNSVVDPGGSQEHHPHEKKATIATGKKAEMSVKRKELIAEIQATCMGVYTYIDR